MYKVLVMFDDLQDKVPTPAGSQPWRYFPGDDYPRKGAEPTPERIAELSGENNARGIALIKEVEKPPEEAAEAEAPIETPKVKRRRAKAEK